jgi:GDP-4-dehydro-6-deoxy-D-mannose reductase
VSEGYEVRGISNRPEYRGTLPPEVSVYLADIGDRASLEPYLAEYRPEVVFHLAGFASPSQARQGTGRAAECLLVNALGTANLLEAVAAAVPRARVVAVTTTHIHSPAQEGTVTEESPMEGRDPYTISKICAHQFCKFYHRERGLNVIEARPTNHYGPGQQPDFVVADFARQAAEISLGRAGPLVRVGNLDVARDFLYVTDVAQAYLALAQKGVPGEAYCVGSDRPVRIREILEILLDLLGKDVKVEVDPNKMRAADVPVLAVKSDKLMRLTGWQPSTPLRQGLEHTLAYWRSQAADGRQ